MKKWKLLPGLLTAIAVGTASTAVVLPSAGAEESFVDFWKKSDQGNQRIVNQNGACRHNVAGRSTDTFRKVGLTYFRSQKAVEELGTQAPNGAQRRFVNQFGVKSDPNNQEARFISSSAFTLNFEDLNINGEQFPAPQPKQLKQGDPLFGELENLDGKLPEDPNLQSTKIAKDVNPAINGTGPTHSYSYTLNDDLQFTRDLRSGEHGYGLTTNTYSEQNPGNYTYDLSIDFLPYPWETHACKSITLDKAKATNQQLVVDGSRNSTGIKVATNPEDLKDHANNSRFVAAVYYSDGVTPVHNPGGEHATATVNDNGEVEVSLPEGSFAAEIKDSQGRSVAGDKEVTVKVFALPRNTESMRSKFDPNGQVETNPAINAIYGDEYQEYLKDPSSFPASGVGLAAYFRDFSYIESATLSVDDEGNHNYNYIDARDVDEQKHAVPGKWVELDWTYQSTLPSRAEFNDATAVEVAEEFNAKYKIVSSGQGTNVPNGWKIEFSDDYSKLRVFAPEGASSTEALVFKTAAVFSNNSVQERNFLFKVEPRPFERFAATYPVKSVWQGTTESSDINVKGGTIREGYENSKPSRYAIKGPDGKPVDSTFIDGWKLEIDPSTGKVSATAPEGADPAVPLEVPVLALFGQGDAPYETKATFYPLSIQEVPVPNYTLVSGEPGSTVTNEPTIPMIEEGDKIVLSTPDTYEDDKGHSWSISISPDTGVITADIPSNAVNGDKLILPVEFEFTPKDGPAFTGTTNAYFTVVDDASAPAYPPSVTTPGADPFRVAIENAKDVNLKTIKTDNIPDGWNVEVEPGGILLITPPKDQPDSPLVPIDISFEYNNGTPGKTKEWVTITEDPAPAPQPITRAVTKEKRNELDLPGLSVDSVVDKDGIPDSWNVEVQNGKLVVTPGPDSTPGQRGEVVVKATDKDNKETELKLILINVPEQVTPPATPDTIVEIVDNGKTEEIDVGDNITNISKTPDNWNISFDGSKITVTPDDSVKNGERVDVTVTTDKGDRKIVLVNKTPNSGGPIVTPGTPGKEQTVPIVINNIINVESNDLPDGWELKEKDGKIIVVPPEGAKPGIYEFNITTTDKDGNKHKDTVVVVVENSGKTILPKSKDGSSAKGIEQCVYNLADSPLLFLLPLGLLLAIGGPILQTLAPEIQRVAASVGAEANSSRSNGPGLGGNILPPEPEWLRTARAQMNSLIEPLNRALGIRTDAAQLLGGGVALIAAIAYLSHLCTADKGASMSSTGLGAKIMNEEGQDTKDGSSSDSKKTENSSDETPADANAQGSSQKDKDDSKSNDQDDSQSSNN